MFGALIAQQLQDWAGPSARLVGLRFRFKNLVYAGETVRCSATVTAVEDDLVKVDCRIDVLGDATLGSRSRPPPRRCVSS